LCFVVLCCVVLCCVVLCCVVLCCVVLCCVVLCGVGVWGVGLGWVGLCGVVVWGVGLGWVGLWSLPCVQLTAAIAAARGKTEALERAYLVKKKTLEMLPEASSHIASLQKICSGSAAKLVSLAAEWEKHRRPKIEAVRQHKESRSLRKVRALFGREETTWVVVVVVVVVGCASFALRGCVPSCHLTHAPSSSCCV